MATDLTDVIKQGYMRCKSRSLGLWQKRWIVLRKSSSKGPCRLEKYINEYSARNLHQHKVQLLINVNGIDRISSNHKKHAFQIDFSDGSSKSFACESGKLTANLKTFFLNMFLTLNIFNIRPRGRQLGKTNDSRMFSRNIRHCKWRTRCFTSGYSKRIARTV